MRKAMRIWLLGLSFAFFIGCGRDHEGKHRHDEKDAEGVTFNAKHGLYVPLETAKFIGLRVADVEERKVPSAFEFSAHVYRATSELKFVSAESTERATALASASLSSSEAGLLRNGQTVTVKAGGEDLRGMIVGIKHDLEKASGHVEVLLTVFDERARLARGEFVSVSAALGGEKSAMSVPRSALLRTVEGDFVYTASGEHFVRTRVKVGASNGEFAEVIDGLLEGDKVVVNPVMTLWLAELQSVRGGKACADGH